MAKARPVEQQFTFRALFRPASDDLFRGHDSGLNSDGRGRGFTSSWHRGNPDYSPFAIWNELICAELGRAIRLPIPPFAMTDFREEGKRRWLFSSLDFNFARATLPEVIPELCVRHMEFLTAGVLAFDIWIANEDRHDANLVVDNVARPTLMHVYDHDQALFGGCDTRGAERFSKLVNRLGVTGSTVTGGNRHIFLPYITKCKSLLEWCNRIHSIPDWFVEDVCKSATTYGLGRSDAIAATEFLLFRKNGIRGLVLSHRDAFAITDWPAQLEFLI